ncbi:hypothetical protein F5B22DRAFT_397568 [Xylaria bambusicola]|uniref:uncharacterized protein n=1 Tax=Xylaria bambusicola TaxID=326684 RepID=UPI00200874DE|nr:uncharacterized protein F5B22DRAFT_397568 [Xylaria bambusicola]KAI0508453.1 hypothetical protein F5B22DRAFT_397568 [Xylaria bambusicola]
MELTGSPRSMKSVRYIRRGLCVKLSRATTPFHLPNDSAKSITMSHIIAFPQAAVRDKAEEAKSFIHISPFASRIISVSFDDRTVLLAHSRKIHISPKLYDQFQYGLQLHLRGVPSSAGHVLINFLYTGKYEGYKPFELTPYEQKVYEFKTSVWVYKIAQIYELPDLQGLAKREIEDVGIYLREAMIVEVLGEVFPQVGKDEEFLQTYIKARLRPFIERPVLAPDSWPDSPGKNLSFTNTLLKLINQLLCDMVIEDEVRSPAACAETPSTLRPDYTPTTTPAATPRR